jgi:hypothetical protein
MTVDEETPLLLQQQQHQIQRVLPPLNGDIEDDRAVFDDDDDDDDDDGVTPVIHIHHLPSSYDNGTTTHTNNNNNIHASSTIVYLDSENDDDELLSATPNYRLDSSSSCTRKRPISTNYQQSRGKKVLFKVESSEEEDGTDRDVDHSKNNEHEHHQHHHPSSRSTNGSLLSKLLEQPRRPSMITRDRTEDSYLSEIISDVKDTISEVQIEIIEVLQEDIITPIKPRYEGDHTQTLSALALSVMVFYKVSGGPFGCEPTVKAAGPFLALLGFTIVPLLVSIPEALVTAELGSAYPEPSGGTCLLKNVFFS